MKKLLILFVAMVLAVSGTFAQKTKVQTAWNYMNYDELDKARTNIDEAVLNESTMGMAKAWYYRGLIYQKSYKHPKFANLDPDALKKAAESFNKAIELDTKSEYKEDALKQKQLLGNQFYGLGVEEFNAKQYDKALNAFEGVLSVSPMDTLAMLNSAFSAERSGNKTKAKDYYNQLISIKYKDPKIYVFLGNLYKSESDTAMALTTIQKGRQAFPADNALVIEELNIFLGSGKDKEALESLNVAILGDPNNSSLYFAQGTVFDKLDRKNEAAASYKKAIEIKPDYFDAYYNLGAMYFNEAAEMANKANDLKSNAEYAKAKEKFDARFKEAMPYLEKALELQPTDQNTMVSLKQLYARLNETAKYDLLKVRMEGK